MIVIYIEIFDSHFNSKRKLAQAYLTFLSNIFGTLHLEFSHKIFPSQIHFAAILSTYRKCKVNIYIE